MGCTDLQLTFLVTKHGGIMYDITFKEPDHIIRLALVASSINYNVLHGYYYGYKYITVRVDDRIIVFSVNGFDKIKETKVS